ncbi:MAG: hypothetical protein P1V97_21005 [Planctomycetota bacterium]|nr:hypothetical protein [Planctomycetota bacterium]
MLRTPYPDLEGTCYIEFQAHPYQQKCWLRPSLFYTLDVYDELFSKALSTSLPKYDFYSFIDISSAEFQALRTELLSVVDKVQWSPTQLNEVMFFIDWAEAALKDQPAIAFLGM